MAARILVGVDGSEGAQRALAWALAEATARRADVQVATVRSGPVEFGDSLAHPDRAEAVERARAVLVTAIAEVPRELRIAGLEPLVLEGDPADALCARASDFDLLVVGSRGRGAVAGLLLGSVSAKCAHHSPVPVAIVPSAYREEDGFARTGRILVGVDGSEGAERALEWAVGEAAARGATIDAVTVWPPYDDDMGLELRTFPLRDERDLAETERAGVEQTVLAVSSRHPGAKINLRALTGDPAGRLCAEAPAADLLVVGARGRNAVADLLLGSVGARCAHRAPGPIVIVPDLRRRPGAG